MEFAAEGSNRHTDAGGGGSLRLYEGVVVSDVGRGGVSRVLFEAHDYGQEIKPERGNKR